MTPYLPIALSVAIILGAYLSGSVSFALIISKIMGLPDPRSYGSKNPGANNVLRSGSKIAALLTLLLDALKATLPMLLVRYLAPHHEQGAWLLAATGVAAFLGHIYPVFLRFQGGKGVATALGVLLGLLPWLALGALLAFILVAAVWRYSSLASMCAGVFAALLYWVGDGEFWFIEASYLCALVFMAAMLIYCHRENIERLIQGKESKIGAKKSA